MSVKLKNIPMAVCHGVGLQPVTVEEGDRGSAMSVPGSCRGRCTIEVRVPHPCCRAVGYEPVKGHIGTRPV